MRINEANKDLGRYEIIADYFENNIFRVKRNATPIKDLYNKVVYLQNFNDLAVRDKALNLGARISTILKRNEDNLRKELNSIEASRKEKKGNIFDQLIGELI